jgi:uncharacterized membrane protein YoaK (UPF0700 family)
MFSREGSARSDRQNRQVAGYLAFVGGFVNSCGFVLIGSFTSHVTGNVGRLANDAATGHYAASGTALTMIVSFFAGAFAASVIIESGLLGGPRSRSYACALATEAVLLSLFTLLTYVTASTHPRVQDGEASLLCAAMGMQNALVTRLSGAVVRTTHLTGVVTDLGIECARWLRYWRGSWAGRAHAAASATEPAERPALPKIALLATIAASFFVGATAGAFSAVHYRHAAMLGAAFAVAACAAYAGFNERAWVAKLVRS